MRGPERGRRSPQPRGQDRRYPAAGGQRYAGDRRRRSMSPGRGRSPGHYNNKRMRGPDGPYDQAPGRYDDRDFEAAYDGYHPEQYRPVSPRRGPRQDNGPKSYKAYMMELPDDITPEDAQKKYDEYLTHFWGSARKAYFQSIKDKSETKAKFHPLEQAKGKKVRNEEAQEAAKKFAERLLSGGLNPASKDFNQGQGTDSKSADTVMAEDGAQPQGDAAAQASTQVAPALLWKPERVAADLKLSRQLIEKLDEEKGITSNPLIAADQLNGTSTDETAKESEPAATSTPEEGSKPETAAPTGDTEMTAADADVPSKEADPKTDSPTKTSYQMSVKTDEKSAAVSDSQAGDASTHEATTEVKAAAQVEAAASDGSSPGDVGKLDIHLTYLWEVHRVNFYVGGEWWDPSDRQRWATQKRMVRAPHPEEGEQPDAEQATGLGAEKLESTQVKRMVDQVWQTRLASGDPLEALLHTAQIEEAVDKWVEDKVIKHSDTKWGNALSTKMFVGKDFVLKHIRVKHAEKVDEYKNKMYEDLYWQNYDDMESNRIELAKQAKRDARLAAEAANKEEDLEMPIQLQQGSGFPGLASNKNLQNVGDIDEQGGSGDHANGVQRSGSGLGRNAPKRGRGRLAGGRGQMRGDMGIGGPMAPVGAGMMGGMQAMPGQMFVLAPGAGPLGPFIQVPIPSGGPEQLGMGPQMGNGPPRGGPRGPARVPRAQSGGRGGYGGGPMPMAGRGYGGRGGYYDLDAPENQRGVLDYGDL